MPRYVWLPVLLSLFLVTAGYAYVQWSRSGTGSGLYSRDWEPGTGQGWWDPAAFYNPPRSVEGRFNGGMCIRCHEGITPGIVADWRASGHARAEPPVACDACHGDRHGRLPEARRDAACTNCHGGVVEHSYASSKHGVIVTLQQSRNGWPEPLERGNYRAPGCAYCHQHASDHGDSMNAGRGRQVREWVCSGCHAPRYVADQFAAGTQLLEIGRLKAAEAETVATRHPQGPAALAKSMEQVRKHLRNLCLGAGHQSPDYQWWHGQPALDGDLIRLRDAVARIQRQFRDDAPKLENR